MTTLAGSLAVPATFLPSHPRKAGAMARVGERAARTAGNGPGTPIGLAPKKDRPTSPTLPIIRP